MLSEVFTAVSCFKNVLDYITNKIWNSIEFVLLRFRQLFSRFFFFLGGGGLFLKLSRSEIQSHLPLF